MQKLQHLLALFAISRCKGSETGFLHKIWVRIPEFSQKPGFLDYLGGYQKPGFFTKSGVRIQEFSQKPGFLDSYAWNSETGFLGLIWVRMQEFSQKPGFLDNLNLPIKSLRVQISNSDIDIENR
jgi:hypothetical protein